MNLISERFSTPRDTANIVISEFDRAWGAKRASFERGFKAWRRYFPINYGKWSPEAIQVMQEEMRHPVQFDITGPKVDTLAGSLVADLPDPTWVPVAGQPSVLTESIAEKYYIDKDLYNYDDVFLKVFRDGLVHSGDLAIVEDFDYCGKPHIKFERVLYGFLLWDPYWCTDDDRDAEEVYRISYFSPDRLMKKYSFASEELKAEYRAMLIAGKQYETDSFTQKQSQVYSKVGDEFQVIEKHYLEDINKKRLIGRSYGSEEFIPFPIVDEMGQRDGEVYLRHFAEINNIDWTTVNTSTYRDRIHYVTTVCRQLRGAEIQIETKSNIQVGGLPFYHFTVMRAGGEDMGIPESMEGVEDTINKRESLATELISKANGGSMLVNKNLFDSKSQYDNWSKKKNKPGHSEPVDLDGVKKSFEHIAQNQYPSSIESQISRMYDKVLPIVSRVSDALSSVSDSATSGILFERQFQTNMIANTLMNRNMRQFINNVAEGYFNQFQITYADIQHNVKFRDGRNVTLNKSNGNRVTNDVRSIPRCRVVIAENKKSQTYQMRWRSIWAEMLTSIRGMEAQYPGQAALILKNFMETIDMKDEDKGELQTLNEMTMMIARLNMVSQLTGYQTSAQNNTLMSAQIEAQMQQVMQMLNSQLQPQYQVQQHTAQEPVSTRIQYPEQGGNMNQSPIEAAAGGAQIPPAQTGALT